MPMQTDLYERKERVYHYIRIRDGVPPIDAMIEALQNGDMHESRLRTLLNQAMMTGSIGDFAKEMLIESIV